MVFGNFSKSGKSYVDGGNEMKLKYFSKEFPFIVADVVCYVDNDGNEINAPENHDREVIDYHFDSGCLEIVIG